MQHKLRGRGVINLSLPHVAEPVQQLPRSTATAPPPAAASAADVPAAATAAELWPEIQLAESRRREL